MDQSKEDDLGKDDNLGEGEEEESEESWEEDDDGTGGNVFSNGRETHRCSSDPPSTGIMAAATCLAFGVLVNSALRVLIPSSFKALQVERKEKTMKSSFD